MNFRHEEEPQGNDVGSLRLSIITINYNNARGLQRTLSYLDNNELPHGVEWIVIDGGSTDASLQVIKEKEHLLSLWVSEPDGGIYPAMNKGTALSKGAYLIFMNSGDQFVDGFLTNDFITKDLTTDIVYGDCFATKDQHHLILEKPVIQPSFLDLYRGCICHQAAFIHRSVQEKYPYNEQMILASTRWFFMEAIVWGAARLKYLDRPVAVYDTTGASMVRRTELVEEWNRHLSGRITDALFRDMQKLHEYDVVIRNSRLYNLICYIHGYRGRKKVFENLVLTLARIFFY